MFEFLQGKKTYLVAFGVVVAVLISWVNGDLTLADAIVKGLEGVGLATLRAGVGK